MPVDLLGRWKPMIPSFVSRRNLQIESLAAVRAKTHAPQQCLQTDRIRIEFFSKTVPDQLAQRSRVPNITGKRVGVTLPVVGSIVFHTNRESVDRRALNIRIQPPEIDAQNYNFRRGVRRQTVEEII